ncbi:YqgE/AlgH family protein [Catellatospora vulcania]|uniref:YqgE/AlgH family protein n=1 Tax=Catellatospora vulcania TaxID=1460450 RepID=UPI0012D3E89F
MASGEPHTTRHDNAGKGTGRHAVESLTGHLLVAMPSLRDPNFERTVVFVLAHEADGALGVVLNRPTEALVGDILPGWEPLLREPGVLFEGGPVGTDSAICVARARAGVAGFVGFSRVMGQIGTVDLSRDPARVGQRLECVRVYHGYAGWGAGQLEQEIEENAWLVFEALPSDPFRTQPEELWSLVLRRQGGLTAAVANFPSDVALN